MNNSDTSFLHWRSLARRHPSAFLLTAQLLSLILYAVFDGTDSGRALLGAFGVLVLALAVWVVIRTPAIRWIAWILAVPAFLLTMLSALFVNQNLLVLSSLMKVSVYFYAAGSLIAYMMEDHRVTADELFAAAATFTLISWGFSYLFVVCQIWFPGSFIGGTNPGQYRTFIELLFLSVTNLSATGLSDIIPVSSPARIIVMLEQFAGIAYITVVVSRLIGMTIVHFDRKEPS